MQRRNKPLTTLSLARLLGPDKGMAPRIKVAGRRGKRRRHPCNQVEVTVFQALRDVSQGTMNRNQPFWTRFFRGRPLPLFAGFCSLPTLFFSLLGVLIFSAEEEEGSEDSSLRPSSPLAPETISWICFNARHPCLYEILFPLAFSRAMIFDALVDGSSSMIFRCVSLRYSTDDRAFQSR